MDQPFFTIFTPIFNGANHFERVSKSVNSQLFKNFEWIIVNDGFTDNTAELVRHFIKNNPQIDIKYIEQKNLGKHIAWNNALLVAKGKFFVPADADDSFIPETLQFFHTKWIHLNAGLQNKLSGINVLCYDNDSASIVGNLFPEDAFITNNLQLFYKYKVVGEKWGCIRTDLLKDRPFPNIEGSFFPESYLWYSLAKNFNVICYNTPLRRYFSTPNSLTSLSTIRMRTKKMARIYLKYNTWFLKNFGLYALKYSPYNVGSFFYHIIMDILLLINPFKK
ncbi:MAG TPA: glycosyltransferase family 2 protein [Paludibacter sp.]